MVTILEACRHPEQGNHTTLCSLWSRTLIADRDIVQETCSTSLAASAVELDDSEKKIVS